MKKINVRQLNLLKLSKVRGCKSNKYRLEQRQKKVLKHHYHKFWKVKNLNRQVFIDHVENCMKLWRSKCKEFNFYK